MKSLKSFIEKNIGYKKEHVFYSESFGNLTYDYLGSVGYEITKHDEEYLKNEGYSIEDFEEDDYKILVR